MKALNGPRLDMGHDSIHRVKILGVWKYEMFEELSLFLLFSL